jgi:hypothetical protein
MDANSPEWKELFSNWPDAVPRRGVLVTSFDEQIPFTGFWTSKEFLLVERRIPDSLGSRMVVVPYDNVSALKITEVLQANVFRAIGFDTPPPQQ